MMVTNLLGARIYVYASKEAIAHKPHTGYAHSGRICLIEPCEGSNHRVWYMIDCGNAKGTIRYSSMNFIRVIESPDLGVSL